MISIPGFILRLALWLLLAPLLPGIINKVKAWVAGRRGPPVLQLYFDLMKLWQKEVVLSTFASPGFVAAPAVAWVALTGAAMLLPLGPAGAALSFRGDVLLLIYLLALARPSVPSFFGGKARLRQRWRKCSTPSAIRI